MRSMNECKQVLSFMPNPANKLFEGKVQNREEIAYAAMRMGFTLQMHISMS